MRPHDARIQGRPQRSQGEVVVIIEHAAFGRMPLYKMVNGDGGEQSLGVGEAQPEKKELPLQELYEF